MAKKRIEINNVFFNYDAGDMFIVIWTCPNGQWAMLPDYLKVQFSINAPTGEPAPLDAELAHVVAVEIRKKIAEQRKSGKFARIDIKCRESKAAEKMRANDNLFGEWE